MGRSRSALRALTLAPALPPTPRRRQHPESAEQRLFVQHVRLDPRTRDLPTCAVPNGGKRGVVEAARLKAEGVSRGVPDWLCFAPNASAPNASYDVGLALEFKAPRSGRVGPDQAWWHAALRACGWRVEIVTSAEGAWTVLCDHLGITP